MSNDINILVVDDLGPMRQIMAGNLRSFGYKEIKMAQNGEEAIGILKTFPINLILSDWNMPVMTGLELLQWTRQQNHYKYTPFIMITAEVKREQIAEAISNGVTDFVLKPFTANTLLDRIQRSLKKKPSVPEPKTQAQSKPLVKIVDPFTLEVKEEAPEPPIKAPSVMPPAAPIIMPEADALKSRQTSARDDMLSILVVDDVPDNLAVISGLLQSEYKVKVATNGETALKRCEAADQPSLVLLDIMMPEMDGYEVIRRLKSNELTSEIPVIFITALDDPMSIVKGLEAGAVDYITKPIEPSVLKARVKNFLRYHRGYKELRDTLDTMMENSKLKEEVTHIVRHDMKSPLSAIIALASQLQTQNPAPEVKMIEDAAYTLLNMINLSTDLYKIEIGQYVLKPKQIDMIQLINRVVREIREEFAPKKLNMSIKLPAAQGLQRIFALGEELLCYSVLHNLIKNAAEASKPGGAIDIHLVDGDPLIISIHNDGAVPEAIRANFFDKFVTSGKQNGTGLGTYSARLLVEAQKGSIVMNSSEQEGTTVEVSLPKWQGDFLAKYTQ